MTRKLLHALILPVLMLTAGRGGGEAQGDKADARAAFALLKSLEGQWKAPDGTTKKSTVRFELSANGTVLVEHYVNPALPGGGQMMSAYHLDGADLLLTHYCIANNQPTLKVDRFDAGAREMQFEFVRATNLPAESRGHMRRAKYRVIDKDNFTTEWEFFENGARKFTEVETFTRVK